MTVEELIAFLRKLPKKTVVGCLFERFSDYAVLEESDIRFFPEGVKERSWLTPRRYVLRYGKIMEYDEKTWDPNEVPHFVPVVVFPGN